MVSQGLVDRMKQVFGTDQRRIDHALAVLDYAERIRQVEGGDPAVVQAAALLHDIGIHEAERRHGSAGGRYQEIEGPPIARGILESLGWGQAEIEHVCLIVGSHHTGKRIDTPEFRCIWDADWIVNLGDDYATLAQDKKRRLIETTLRTDTGRGLALERYSM